MSKHTALNSNKPSPSKLQKTLVIASLILTFSGTITAIMTFSNTGLTSQFLPNWLKAFGLSALIMAPCGALFSFLLHKLVTKTFKRTSYLIQNLIFAVFMAFIMESIMAAMTAATNVGFNSITIFTSAWINGVLWALPLGLVLSVLMSTTIKPKLEKYLAS
ncbi:DUF2798 domain-containing protein [Marinicellulosiphila megalodicopiae]|uniref:DUF2798 domain-containing protein n=1 Tax=Marinicellulosiphila megalodicopiae TaxID=2724896 RepID=UPI003BAE5CB3